MPQKDIDGGLNFQGYNPRVLTGRLPKEQIKFYVGGNNVPFDLALKAHPVKRYSITQKVMTLPSIMK
jgi:hypothetical protein